MKDKFFELSVFSSQNEILKEFAFDLGVTCVEEITNGFIIRDEEDPNLIEFGLCEFAKRAGIDIKTQITQKDNIDWIEKYKNSINPIRVGKFYVRPSWCERNGDIDIVINPALAFGSGHHESTNACLNLISEFVEPNLHKTAIDVGCGSGILSIALAKLGLSVDSCDTDEQAVLATKENAEKNAVLLNQIWNGSITNTNKKYDLIIANIIADVILVLSPNLKGALNNGGYLILSGILNKYKDKILKDFSDLNLIKHITQNEWESFIFKEKNGK